MNDSFDDYDFTPTSSSSLALLFNNSTTDSESSSLIYTALKQPQAETTPQSKPEPGQGKSNIICAYVVQVWKQEDRNYIAMGKHGLAIVGFSTQDSYELILYKSKTNVIKRSKIDSQLQFSVMNRCFIAIDDGISPWLVKCKNIEEHTSFLSFIGKYSDNVIALPKVGQYHRNDDADSTRAIAGSDTSSTSPDNMTKADILTRIAKMGQSILPSKNLDFDDQEPEDNTVKALPQTTNKIYGTQVANLPTHTISSANIIQPQNIPTGLVISQPGTYDPFNLYVAENRTHNSEIRVNLNEISNKLNQIMQVVNKNDAGSDYEAVNAQSKIKVLELTAENLTKRLLQLEDENRKLKLTINEQENAIYNTECREHELNLAKERESANTQQINALKTNLEMHLDTSEIQKVEMDALKTRLEIYQNDNAELQRAISEKDEAIQVLELKLQDFAQNHATETTKSEVVSNFSIMLKAAMSEMYGNIFVDLTHDEDTSIIAKNIKLTTSKIIQSFQKIYETD